MLLGNSQVIFEKAESSSMCLVGECPQHTRRYFVTRLKGLPSSLGFRVQFTGCRTALCKTTRGHTSLILHSWLCLFDTAVSSLSRFTCAVNVRVSLSDLLQGRPRPESLVSPSSAQTGTLRRWALAAWTRSFLTSSAEPSPPESSLQT